MNSAVSHSVRGWCPGALRPMESGDGLIVRIRPRCGAIATSILAALADLAERYGSGAVDFTRRANIQLRGIRAEMLPELWRDLTELELLDESAEAEAVRNVLVSPLAGLDPSEVADARVLARELEDMIAADPRLWQLPGKFGFVVDGGGPLTLDRERGDIRLKRLRAGTSSRISLGVDRPQRTAWLGDVSEKDAASAAREAALAFLSPRPSPGVRMRDLAENVFQELATRTRAHLEPLECDPVHVEPIRELGVISRSGTAIAVGLALPFGRGEARVLSALADMAQRYGIRDVRLSPWRTIYLAVPDAAKARAVATAAAGMGFITDASDPLGRIDACPGAPGCTSTPLDTRRLARQVAPLMAQVGCDSCHVSGCAKGCARSEPADLVLVGIADGIGVLRNDTAQGHPSLVVASTCVDELPDILKRL